MADPQSIEADSAFSNRRVTRLGFKRASLSQENDPKQKKPEALSKQKPGVLPKTDGNQLEQQQEQHREGNDATEVRQPLTGEALKEYERVQNEIWRGLTQEEWEKYSKIVDASEGFDTVDLPMFIINYGGLIRPVKPSNEEQLDLEKCSKSAIATFNKQNKTKYRFVEVIKATYTLGNGIFYKITFVAKDKEVDSTKNFQAAVRFHFRRPKVEFCRVEQPPKEVVECKCKYEWKDKDPNEPEKPLGAMFWFWEEFTMRYKEKHPNASDDDAGHAAGRVWPSMDDAAREPYEQIAAKKMAEYHQNLEAYKKRLAEERVKEEESENLRSQVNDEDKDKDDERKNKKSRRRGVEYVVKIETRDGRRNNKSDACGV